MTADDVQEKIGRISHHAKNLGLLEAEAIVRALVNEHNEDGATWRAAILTEAAAAISARVTMRDSFDRRDSE